MPQFSRSFSFNRNIIDSDLIEFTSRNYPSFQMEHKVNVLYTFIYSVSDFVPVLKVSISCYCSTGLPVQQEYLGVPGEGGLYAPRSQQSPDFVRVR